MTSAGVARRVIEQINHRLQKRVRGWNGPFRWVGLDWVGSLVMINFEIRRNDADCYMKMYCGEGCCDYGDGPGVESWKHEAGTTGRVFRGLEALSG